MNYLFFLNPFLVRNIKSLKKIAEPDDMNQLMGKNIYKKGQESKISVSIERP